MLCVLLAYTRRTEHQSHCTLRVRQCGRQHSMHDAEALHDVTLEHFVHTPGTRCTHPVDAYHLEAVFSHAPLATLHDGQVTSHFAHNVPDSDVAACTPCTMRGCRGTRHTPRRCTHCRRLQRARTGRPHTVCTAARPACIGAVRECRASDALPRARVHLFLSLDTRCPTALLAIIVARDASPPGRVERVSARRTRHVRRAARRDLTPTRQRSRANRT